MNPRVWTIARREFLATVTRKGFLLTLVLMPAWVTFASTVGTLPDRLARKSNGVQAPKPVGVVDSAGVLGMTPSERDTFSLDSDAAGEGSAARHPRRYVARSYSSLAEARADFERGALTAFLVIPADYVKTGKVSEYRHSSGLFSRIGSVPWRSWMRRRLLAGRVDASLIARVQNPSDGPSYVPNGHGGYKMFRPEDELAGFLVPFSFGMLLIATIFISSGYLIQGLGEEKESRILESLLSSVTPDELMMGKLFGLGAAGLLLGFAWGALELQVVTVMAPVFLPTPGVLAILFVYFVLGYLLFGAIALGLGSLVNSYQEATTVSAILSFTAFVPMMLTLSFLEEPNSPVLRVLSLVPISAPTTMAMRLAMGAVPAWEIALSLALLALTGWFAVTLSGRVFRVALLLYGKTWNLPEIMRWVGKDRPAKDRLRPIG